MYQTQEYICRPEEIIPKNLPVILFFYSQNIDPLFLYYSQVVYSKKTVLIQTKEMQKESVFNMNTEKMLVYLPLYCNINDASM